MLAEEQGAGRNAMDDQGAEEHGHDDIGRNSEGEKRNKGSLGRRIIGRFGRRHPSITPVPNFSGYFETLFSMA